MLERLRGPRALRVLGVARGAVHLDLDGFVVSVTSARVPLLPNGVRVAEASARRAPGWDPADPPAWDPVLRPPAGGRAAVAALARWLAARVAVPDADPMTVAGRLLGRGPGLTPEGDDVLAGMAAGIHALGPAAGMDPGRVMELVGALVPAGLEGRTGRLSATLLRLAASGAAPEPVHRLVAGAGREDALADLSGLGSSTGTAIAAGLARAAQYVLGATGPG